MLFTQLRRYCQVRSEHSDSPAGPAQRAERAEHAEQNGVLHIPMTRDCWKDKELSRKRLGQDKKQAPNKSKHFVQKANTCLLKASTCLLTTKSEHLTNKSEHLTNKSEHFPVGPHLSYLPGILAPIGYIQRTPSGIGACNAASRNAFSCTLGCSRMGAIGESLYCCGSSSSLRRASKRAAASGFVKISAGLCSRLCSSCRSRLNS